MDQREEKEGKMSREKLIVKGKLIQLEEQKKILEAKARAAILVLRTVFNDIDVRLDSSKFVDIDLEMATVVLKDLRDIQEEYRQLLASIKELKD